MWTELPSDRCRKAVCAVVWLVDVAIGCRAFVQVGCELIEGMSRKLLREMDGDLEYR